MSGDVKRIKQRQGDDNKDADPWICLNVGGQSFETFRSTLCRKSAYFRQRLAPDTPLGLDASVNDENDGIRKPLRVDRSATLFEHVLRFLRNPKYALPLACLDELEFYGIEGANEAPLPVAEALDDKGSQGSGFERQDSADNALFLFWKQWTPSPPLPTLKCQASQRWRGLISCRTLASTQSWWSEAAWLNKYRLLPVSPSSIVQLNGSIAYGTAVSDLLIKVPREGRRPFKSVRLVHIGEQLETEESTSSSGEIIRVLTQRDRERPYVTTPVQLQPFAEHKDDKKSNEMPSCVHLDWQTIDVYNRLFVDAAQDQGQVIWRLPFPFVHSGQEHPLLVSCMVYHKWALQFEGVTDDANWQPTVFAEVQYRDFQHRDALCGSREAIEMVTPTWQEICATPIAVDEKQVTGTLVCELKVQHVPLRRLAIVLTQDDEGLYLPIARVQLRIDGSYDYIDASGAALHFDMQQQHRRCSKPRLASTASADYVYLIDLGEEFVAHRKTYNLIVTPQDAVSLERMRLSVYGESLVNIRYAGGLVGMLSIPASSASASATSKDTQHEHVVRCSACKSST